MTLEQVQRAFEQMDIAAFEIAAAHANGDVVGEERWRNVLSEAMAELAPFIMSQPS